MNLPDKDISVAMSVIQLAVAVSSLLATSFLGLFLRLPNLSQGLSYLLFTCLGAVVLALGIFVVTLQKRNLKIEEEEQVTEQLV